jgi:hypothetical protein
VLDDPARYRKPDSEETAMASQTTDEGILQRIQTLVDEEHALLQGDTPAGEASRRLGELQIQLDQAWDLLRQRRARREFGDDPDAARVRPPEVVESYEQ